MLKKCLFAGAVLLTFALGGVLLHAGGDASIPIASGEIRSQPRTQAAAGPQLVTETVNSVRLTTDDPNGLPNGLAGFSVLLEDPSIPLPAIDINSDGFTLSALAGGIVVSGVDLNQEYEAGAVDIELLRYEGPQLNARAVQLDDDSGNPIVLGGQ